MERRPVEKPDISEKGSAGQAMNRRLFMQLLTFGDANDAAPLINAVASTGGPAVVYEDLQDPRGLAVLTMNENPAFFIDVLRPQLKNLPLTLKPDLCMFGRTYSLGYEPDLEEALFHRPTRTAMNPDWPWVVWYPLRRKGSFMAMSEDEQRRILMEHGTIGRAFGEADLAHDIRLACHGLDTNDNDFVIGLTGRELAGLSAIVQTMRKTVQTSQYIERLGPFFVGKAVWRG